MTSLSLPFPAAFLLPTQSPEVARARPLPTGMTQAVACFLLHLQAINRSPETIGGYGRDLRSLRAFLLEHEPSAAHDVRLVDLAVLRRWLHAYRETHSAASVARAIAATRAWMRWLMQHEVLAHNAAADLQRPKRKPLFPKYLSVEAAGTLVEAPATPTVTYDEVRLARDRAILELLYGSGVRATEASLLDLEDVVLSEREARVLGKGAKERVVPLGGPCVEAMRGWLAARATLPKAHPRAFFLALPSCKRIRRYAIYNLVKRWGRAIGTPDVYPHLLRHSCATHMLWGGANLREIQELLGHATISTTAQYAHVDMPRLLKVYRAAHPLAEPGGGDGFKTSG